MIDRIRAFGLRRLAAYAATWIIWGSTYLAIRIAVRSMPPLLLVGVRSLTAGAVLVAWGLLRRDARPTRAQVGAAVATGAMFFLVGHGGLFWAERRVASGPAALMIATEHFWLLLAGALLGRAAATRRAWAGVAVGLGGVAALTLGGSSRGGVDPLGAAVLLVASLAWSLGTLYFTGPRKPKAQPFAAGLPLLGGGVLVLIASVIAGEPRRLDLARVEPLGVAALAYLIVFGSVIAFTAYSWLVEREGPARALSFTYVNPLVAVVLGAVAAHEPLTPRVAFAAAAIVAAVILIIGGTSEPEPAAASGASRPPAIEEPGIESGRRTRRGRAARRRAAAAAPRRGG